MKGVRFHFKTLTFRGSCNRISNFSLLPSMLKTFHKASFLWTHFTLVTYLVETTWIFTLTPYLRPHYEMLRCSGNLFTLPIFIWKIIKIIIPKNLSGRHTKWCTENIFTGQRRLGRKSVHCFQFNAEMSECLEHYL